MSSTGSSSRVPVALRLVVMIEETLLDPHKIVEPGQEGFGDVRVKMAAAAAGDDVNRRLQRKHSAQCLDLAFPLAVSRRAILPPALDATGRQRFRAIPDQQGRIAERFRAEPFASGAGTDVGVDVQSMAGSDWRRQLVAGCGRGLGDWQ